MKKYIRSASYVHYDKDGESRNFHLDFDDPRDLYRELEDAAGSDFATQFIDEFER